MPDVHPLVSIILPTYNGAAYLRQSIESCLTQTYVRIELIVIDDGSTDGTPDIIRSFKDVRLSYVRHGKNHGHIAALNKGFAMSRGALLTWTSDDNYYAPQAIAVMVGALQEFWDVDMVYAPYYVINKDGAIQREGRIEDPSALDEDNRVGACFLYRRKVYEIIGDYHQEAFLAEDYEYWLRVREKFRMKRLEEGLYYYREHEKSLTGVHKEEKVQLQVERIRTLFISEWKNDFLLGRKALLLKDRMEARRRLLSSIAGNPFFLPSWRLLVSMYLRRQ